jgi:dTDP-3-amino-3,4,6-trideoxy-alpha-D-glucose transaminase
MVKRIPVVDLRRRAAGLEPALSQAVARVVESGHYLLGPETASLEAELAAFLGRRHVVAVASGTEALRLALAAMGIGPDDEVIVPALTAVPTAAAVCALGAVPVPVDVDDETAGIDVEAARSARTSRTRAVVPVHLYGRPAELPDLDVPILEDAAQAIGALDASAPSVAAAYSFYPTKNLGGIGDGGAVVTDDEVLAADVRSRRIHGRTIGGRTIGGRTIGDDPGDYEHTIVSGNSRLSEVEAAALRVGLLRLPEQTARRRDIAARYREAAPSLRWQVEHPRHVHHLCVVRVTDRGAFRAGLPFDTAIHYPAALTQQPAYARFVRQPCPRAEAWAAECVSLPCFPEMTDDEIEAVCRALK